MSLDLAGAATLEIGRLPQPSVTQHYDTLQAIGADTNSNLILLPNSPQAGSEMLNSMVASFTASNQVGESMKTANSQKRLKNKDKKDEFGNLEDA